MIRVNFFEGDHGHGQATIGNFYPKVNIPQKNKEVNTKNAHISADLNF